MTKSLLLSACPSQLAADFAALAQFAPRWDTWQCCNQVIQAKSSKRTQGDCEKLLENVVRTSSTNKDRDYRANRQEPPRTNTWNWKITIQGQTKTYGIICAPHNIEWVWDKTCIQNVASPALIFQFWRLRVNTADGQLHKKTQYCFKVQTWLKFAASNTSSEWYNGILKGKLFMRWNSFVQFSTSLAKGALEKCGFHHTGTGWATMVSLYITIRICLQEGVAQRLI